VLGGSLIMAISSFTRLLYLWTSPQVNNSFTRLLMSVRHHLWKLALVLFVLGAVLVTALVALLPRS
jgi:hypothetical protein